MLILKKASLLITSLHVGVTQRAAVFRCLSDRRSSVCARATGFSKASAGNKGGKKGNEGGKGGSKGGATKGNMTEQQALMLKVSPSILAEASVRAPRELYNFLI